MVPAALIAAPAESPSRAYKAASAKEAIVPMGGGAKLRAPRTKWAAPDRKLPRAVYLPKVLALFRVQGSSFRMRACPLTKMVVEPSVGRISSLTVPDLTLRLDLRNHRYR